MKKISMYYFVACCLYCGEQNKGRSFGKHNLHFWCSLKNFFTRKCEKKNAERMADFERYEMEGERCA